VLALPTDAPSIDVKGLVVVVLVDLRGRSSVRAGFYQAKHHEIVELERRAGRSFEGQPEASGISDRALLVKRASPEGTRSL
jgi:hypothetical protein